MFQKKKSGTGTKKKKKKDKSSTSGSAQSPSPRGERRRRSTSQDRGTKLPQPETAVAAEEKIPPKDGEDVEVEEISQADTDRDAPSIASEVGSPIPFDVSLYLIYFLYTCMYADHMRKSIEKVTNYEMLLAPISRRKGRKTRLYFWQRETEF